MLKVSQQKPAARHGCLCEDPLILILYDCRLKHLSSCSMCKAAFANPDSMLSTAKLVSDQWDANPHTDN